MDKEIIEKTELPSWDLSDLYKSTECSEIDQDLDKLEKLTISFNKKYKGKIYKLNDIKNIVTFTGFLPGKSLDIISGFDLLVMPTIDFEGFGYSIVEAMLAEVPVVASRVGAIPELIVDGESGYLVEPSDISGWQVTIEKLVGNPTLRKHIGMAGKQRIESRFSAESMSKQYYNLLAANEIL